MGNVPTIRTKLTTATAVINAVAAGTALADLYVDELIFMRYYYTNTAPDATLLATTNTLLLNKGMDLLWDEPPLGTNIGAP